MELPKYKCHKVVQAAKILEISHGRSGTQLTFSHDGSVEVDPDWVDNRRAEVGGYYVVYEDGYQSYSPAKAFEEGYTLLRAVEVDDEPMLQFFTWEHLPPHLQKVSQPFGEMAMQMVIDLPRNPERTEGLRKLLEAKDCAVRALLYKDANGD